MSFLLRFKKVPITLFRIQGSKKIVLREKARQIAHNRTSYDFMLHEDGKVHPTYGEKFTKPNGASCRPAGPNLFEIVTHFKGNYIYIIPKDTPLPDELILILEHTDHYSIQTTTDCTEKELNERLNKFLEKMELISKEEFNKKYTPF